MFLLFFFLTSLPFFLFFFAYNCSTYRESLRRKADVHGPAFVPQKLSALNVNSTIKISAGSLAGSAELKQRLDACREYKVAFHFYYA